MKANIFIKIIICLIFLFAIDTLFGFTMNYAVQHAKNGSLYEMNYKLFFAKPEIVILGSSRANHHYNTHLIENKLNEKTINYGQDGSDVAYYYIILKTLINTHKPSLVILDIKPNEFNTFPNFNQYSTLYPFINKIPFTDEDLKNVSQYEKWKLNVNTYRFNNNVVEQINSLTGKKEDTAIISGYLPLPVKKAVMKKLYINETNFNEKLYSYFLKIIELCKINGIKLIVCISPDYNTIVFEKSVSVTEKTCNKNNIQFINYLNNQLINFPDSDFADESHLNYRGADRFTSDFVTRFK